MLATRKEAQGQTINSVEDDSKTKILFKTIMCPLGDTCPKVKKARWPSSSIKAVTQFGANCPYAHHMMELVFPETLNTKIAVTQNRLKKAGDEVKTNAASKPFMPSGAILKKHTPHISDEDMKAKAARLRNISLKQQDDNLTTYFNEMKEIKDKLQIDDNYCKKFGLLKKASVLSYYGRENEAFNEIAKAVQITKEQK